MSDAEQYLDLIAENAQIKAEIQSLKIYDNTIRLFDRKILKVCADQTLGRSNPIPQFITVITNIKNGIPPVESAESFKQIMMAERIAKISEKQKLQISKYKAQKEEVQKKYDVISKLVSELEARVEEHQKTINDSENIQKSLQEQIEIYKKAIEEAKQKTTALTDEVTKSQAQGLELRRSISRAQSSLSQYVKSGAVDQSQIDSIRNIVHGLRKSSTIQSQEE
ncbi:hypothetical protein TRFO_16744 [Tritrichomonas foetus]|uniref:Uncharacterized protein n=1 Tax=Tritrichomonas foetus TaxID=1144522 RepID=A0A1J4KUL5_9EUKA|nr:hypothetical protein TRFO_16744 [Tritrichomonas foetus]|eukprot:OHT13189.1 hypothetical protein TRFO_16744 [Tritrichomonas foetus]